MSKTLLQQLYDGEIYPAEQINPQNPEYWELCRKLGAERDYFREKFSGSDRERFAEMDNMYQAVTNIYGYEDFTYGFRLGVGLLIEALSSGKEITPPTNT